MQNDYIFVNFKQKKLMIERQLHLIFFLMYGVTRKCKLNKTLIPVAINGKRSASGNLPLAKAEKQKNCRKTFQYAAFHAFIGQKNVCKKKMWFLGEASIKKTGIFLLSVKILRPPRPLPLF